MAKKMFLTYSGSVADFKNSGKATECNNSIVFIGNGDAIYTHGQYFGDLTELLEFKNNLKYFSKIKVDGTEAEASSVGGNTLSFESTDKETTVVTVDTTGIKIGVANEFKNAVSKNTADIVDITEQITNLLGKDQDLEGRLSSVESLLGSDIEGSDSVVAQIAALQSALDTTNDNVESLEERVETNEANIGTILGDYLKSSDRTDLEDAIETAKQEAITTILGGEVNADFNTLKEVAEWILSDTTGAAALQTTVAQHTQDIQDINNELDTLSENLNNEIARSTEIDTELSNKINTLEESINNNAGVAAEYTINGYKISTNPTLVASDIEYTEEVTVEAAVTDLYGLWEWGEA